MAADSARQVGTVPYLTSAEGHVEVKPITSPDANRWIIPSGSRVKGLQPQGAAAGGADSSGIVCPPGALHVQVRHFAL